MAFGLFVRVIAPEKGVKKVRFFKYTHETFMQHVRY